MNRIGESMKRNGLLVKTLLAVALLSTLGGPTFGKEAGSSEMTFDGLKLVPDSKVAAAYVRPEADFSVYKRVKIMEAEVAFRQGWERDQNRSIHRITSRDIAQLKERAANTLREVFVEVLEADDGYQVVSEAAADVLLLRPAILDLDITNPDTGRQGRGNTFVSSAGAATLLLELFDSVSGEILARFVDRQGARDFGTMRLSTSARTSAEGRRIMTGWAKLLRKGLDEVHGGAGVTAEP